MRVCTTRLLVFVSALLVARVGFAQAGTDQLATDPGLDDPAAQPATEPEPETQPEPATQPAAQPATQPAAQPATQPSTTSNANPPASGATSSPPPRRNNEQVLTEDSDPQTRDDDEDDEENWGVFWIEAQAGYSFINLVQFNQDNFIPEAEEISGSGFFGGVALGFRLYFITLGARATVASYFGFEVGTVGADVAVHLPIPVISPYLRVGLGYAWMGDADWTNAELSRTDVNGLVVDGGLGLNIKLGRVVSLGAGFDVAFLNLGRQSARDAGTVGDINLEETGDAVGLQIRVHGHLTFHI